MKIKMISVCFVGLILSIGFGLMCSHIKSHKPTVQVSQESVDPAEKPEFRIAWVSLHTGATGHSEYMSEQNANAWLNEVQKKYSGDINHWFEPKPKVTPPR